MNFYIKKSPLEMASCPHFRAFLVLVSSSSGMKTAFTAQQRKGPGGIFPTCVPFLSLAPLEKVSAPNT